jgi:hypothetical protein
MQFLAVFKAYPRAIIWDFSKTEIYEAILKAFTLKDKLKLEFTDR